MRRFRFIIHPLLHMNDSTKEQIKRFDGIDSLRTIAVVSVLIYHLNPKILPGGFAGVDMFFVISGFVVCASLFKKNVQTDFLKFIGSFYVRRVVRIYPALMVMLLFCGLYHSCLFPIRR